MTKNEKIAETLKKRFKENGHHLKGIPGRKHTEEQKEVIRQRVIEFADKKGRVSEEHKKARNKANVYAYRARKYNAIIESSDLKLITHIYENCPNGYHVDHIHALSRGGLHHQDNLQYLPISENCRKNADRDYDKSLAIDWRTYIPLNAQGVRQDC